MTVLAVACWRLLLLVVVVVAAGIRKADAAPSRRRRARRLRLLLRPARRPRDWTDRMAVWLDVIEEKWMLGKWQWFWEKRNAKGSTPHSIDRLGLGSVIKVDSRNGPPPPPSFL
jgi:hypothetical protein